VQSEPGRHPVVEILCRSSCAAIARSLTASAAAVIIQQGVDGFEGDGAGDPSGVTLRQIVKDVFAGRAPQPWLRACRRGAVAMMPSSLGSSTVLESHRGRDAVVG
jgi:hypothetical protein